MNRAQLLAALQDDVAALCRPYEHTEIGAERSSWTTHHLPLLTQLRVAAVAATTPDTNGPKKPASSKPPLDIEILDLLVAAKLYGILAMHLITPRPRLRPSPEANLRYVAGHTHQLPDPSLLAATTAITALRHRTEITLSWIRAPYRLRGSCPDCAVHDRLVVHLDDHGPTDALCTACGTTWPAPQLGILARHLAANSVDSVAHT